VRPRISNAINYYTAYTMELLKKKKKIQYYVPLKFQKATAVCNRKGAAFCPETCGEHQRGYF
jgi:hypothetical protein